MSGKTPRVILTDVDGTLIGKGSEIQPKVLESLEKARNAGLHLAICTGRPVFSRAAEFAQIVSPTEPHIFQNGAHVVTLDGRSIHQSILNHASYVELVALSRRISIALEVYTATRCFVEQHTAIAEAHERLIEIKTHHADLLSLSEPVLRAQWVHTRSERAALEAATRAIANVQFSSAGTPDMPDALFTSVTQVGTSKLEGATALAKHHGVTLEEVMMVGDGDNDIEILEAVGWGVAMGNASPGAKAAAKYHVGDVEDSGLAEAIELALETRAVRR
jgi:Cof subfamily protein (haloacid dehalogenase superfamily)